MKRKIKDKNNILRRWLIIIFAIFFILIISLILSAFSYQQIYEKKIYPGVKIGQLNISGKTPQQAFRELELIKEKILKEGLKFKYGKKEVVISPITITAGDPDLAHQILIFDLKKSIDNAYQIGRRGGFLINWLERIKILIYGKQLSVVYSLNREELFDSLKINFGELEKPAKNVQLNITGNEIEVIKEKEGEIFNFSETINQVEKNIILMKTEPIELKLVKDEPKIKKQDTEDAIKLAEEILKITPLTLKIDSRWWKIHSEQFVSWLEFQLDENNQVTIGFNQDLTFEFLKEIANVVDVKPQDAKFKLEEERVIEFQANRDGKKLDLEKSWQKINEEVVKNKKQEIELVVTTTPAKIKIGDLNNLGIKELLGQGKSNFSGSPKNRRHNISVGAKVLNGILIKPEEEFSLLKALGKVDATTGYLPELVIKGNRTIPEYGGGLCQIGTTTFRAALYSGLPITQRRNHSYRVVYYEPAGMDATIYNPSPDLKFINDTGNYILFTTKIEGDNLIFEFYGKKDGRQIEIIPEPPKIYNITNPGPIKYIETEDLKPREKKKVESSHPGADTEFIYKVTYPNGEVKEKVFYSHYVPWPEVWLVGKEPSATSTDTISNQQITNNN